MRVFKPTDRIEFDFKKLKMWFSPFSYATKLQIASSSAIKSGTVIEQQHEVVYTMVKNHLKEIKGLKDLDGKDFELKFEEDGTLTEDCTEMVIMAEMDVELDLASAALINKKFDVKGAKVKFKGGGLPKK